MVKESKKDVKDMNSGLCSTHMPRDLLSSRHTSRVGTVKESF
jgi:hypothetical protein